MNRYSPKAGLGASSIMLILVTLCLTVFSVLALVSARMDKNLTEASARGAEDYYAADAKAQMLLAELDVLLANGGDPVAAAGVAADGDGYAFTVTVDAGRALYVRFTAADGACRVTEYHVISTADWTPENGGELY